MMRAFAAIALNGFRESIRNRLTVVVAAFAVFLVLFTSVAFQLTVTTLDRTMTDIGIGFISLIAQLLAILLSCGLIPLEINRRTVFFPVSKPVSRTVFFVGRYFGNLIAITFVVAMMFVLFVAQFLYLRGTLGLPHLNAMLGIIAQVEVISAVGIFFSSFTSQFVSAVVTSAMFFIGHMASEGYALAARASEVPKAVGLALYYLLPNLDRLDLTARASYMLPTPASEMAGHLTYAAAYTCVLLAAGSGLFERRDFR